MSDSVLFPSDGISPSGSRVKARKKLVLKNVSFV